MEGGRQARPVVAPQTHYIHKQPTKQPTKETDNQTTKETKKKTEAEATGGPPTHLHAVVEHEGDGREGLELLLRQAHRPGAVLHARRLLVRVCWGGGGVFEVNGLRWGMDNTTTTTKATTKATTEGHHKGQKRRLTYLLESRREGIRDGAGEVRVRRPRVHDGALARVELFFWYGLCRGRGLVGWLMSGRRRMQSTTHAYAYSRRCSHRITTNSCPPARRTHAPPTRPPRWTRPRS